MISLQMSFFPAFYAHCQVKVFPAMFLPKDCSGKPHIAGQGFGHDFNETSRILSDSSVAGLARRNIPDSSPRYLGSPGRLEHAGNHGVNIVSFPGASFLLNGKSFKMSFLKLQQTRI